MRARARVLRLQRARERGHRLEVCALQQFALAALELEHVTQIARVKEQLLLWAGARFLGRAERNAVQAAREPLGDRQEFERAEGLPHERVRARLLRVGGRAAVRTGEHDDRDLRSRGIVLQVPAEIEPGRDRHVDVEHDDARLGALDLAPRGGGTFSFGYVDVRDLEGRAQ